MKRGPVLVDAHLAVRAAAIAVMGAAIAWGLSESRHEDRIGDAVEARPAPLPIARAVSPIADPLFPAEPARAADGDAFNAGDPPDVLGLAGRLPDDVEVLIRDENGGTSALRVGQSAMGWTLASVAADRAVFERDGRQVIRTLN